MGFFRQEYWSGLPCPPPGALANPGTEPRSPALWVDSLSSEPPGQNYKFSYASLVVKTQTTTLESYLVIHRKLNTSNNPATLSLGVYVRETLYTCLGHMYKDVTCSIVFNNEKLICPLMREWLQIFWCINSTPEFQLKMECYTVGKTNLSTWLNLKNNVEWKKKLQKITYTLKHRIIFCIT